MTETEEEEQQGALGEFPQRGRSDGGQDHQQVRIEMAFAQGVQRVAGDVGAGDAIRGQIERQARPEWESQQLLPDPSHNQEYPPQEAEEQLAVVLVPAANPFARDAITKLPDAPLDRPPAGMARAELH